MSVVVTHYIWISNSLTNSDRFATKYIDSPKTRSLPSQPNTTARKVIPETWSRARPRWDSGFLFHDSSILRANRNGSETFVRKLSYLLFVC